MPFSNKMTSSNLTKRTHIYDNNNQNRKKFCSNDVNKNLIEQTLSDSHHTNSNITSGHYMEHNTDQADKNDINNVMLFWYNYMNSFLNNRDTTTINTN